MKKITVFFLLSLIVGCIRNSGFDYVATSLKSSKTKLYTLSYGGNNDKLSFVVIETSNDLEKGLHSICATELRGGNKYVSLELPNRTYNINPSNTVNVFTVENGLLTKRSTGIPIAIEAFKKWLKQPSSPERFHFKSPDYFCSELRKVSLKGK